jgi:hypothetical protein
VSTASSVAFTPRQTEPVTAIGALAPIMLPPNCRHEPDHASGVVVLQEDVRAAIYVRDVYFRNPGM